jgi:two-component system chemotaxis sensor kinase CheA
MSDVNREPMLEMYIFEVNQLTEQLEEILLKSEKVSRISNDDINEIFRIMHTVKGSSAMMMFSNISSLAHSVEDLFYYIRENDQVDYDCSTVCELVISALDFIRNEVFLIEEGKEPSTSETNLVSDIESYLLVLKGKDNDTQTLKEDTKNQEQKFYISKYEAGENQSKYIIQIEFEEEFQMENIRAFTLVHNFKELSREIYHEPEDLFGDTSSSEYIKENGFTIYLSTNQEYEKIEEILENEIYIKSFEIEKVEAFENAKSEEKEKPYDEEKNKIESVQDAVKNMKQSFVSVNINKMDKLLDLVGEIVITEAMVIGNQDLEGMELDNFNKSARQLRKLTDELQDVVMSIRMIPIGPTFRKMHRIIRDMSKKVNKEVELVIKGEDTEVDKNIIDNLGDPLMHLIRNAMDHGIESPEERKIKNKSEKGKIILEASNTGGDVIIKITDDGKGLDREKIINKARKNNLINKTDEEISDREAYSLILLPGFSTKEEVTEYSGRGVGMDVVKKNIEKVGGTISIESKKGKGTAISIKIPLTLAIVEGMQIATGNSVYTIPTISIKEAFKAKTKDLIEDIDGNEMIMIRGKCYPIIRMHKHFNVKANTEDLCEGIMIMIEREEKTIVLFTDELLGEQQVVVKPLPNYLIKYPLKDNGIGGCTILGNGNISLIIDVMALMSKII